MYLCRFVMHAFIQFHKFASHILIFCLVCFIYDTLIIMVGISIWACVQFCIHLKTVYTFLLLTLPLCFVH